MLPFLLILAGGFALGALLDSGSDGEVEDEGPVTDEEGRILVEDGTDYRSANGEDDVFIVRPDVLEGRNGEPLTVDIFSADSDDTFTLLGPDPANDQLLTGSLIRAGGADDVVAVSAGDSVIDAGTGADRVDLHDWGGNQVSLGALDDVLVVQSSNGTGTVVQGDTGADIIDARLATSGSFFGGPGNDTVLIGQQSEPLAAFFVTADGGTGADTMIYQGEPVTSPDAFAPPALQGGGGGDTFAIVFNEASAVDAPDGTETVRLDLVEILDFNPAVDSIVLDPRLVDASYSVGEISLEVDQAADETRIIIPVTSATEINQELVIYVNGTDISANDIAIAAVNTELV